jgi:hypothetical protein
MMCGGLVVRFGCMFCVCCCWSGGPVLSGLSRLRRLMMSVIGRYSRGFAVGALLTSAAAGRGPCYGKPFAR